MFKQAATVVAGVAACAGASVTFYDSRADWQASVSDPIVTEGFEGREGIPALGSPSVFDSGLRVAELTDDVTGRVEAQDGQNPGNNLFNTTQGGSQFLRFGVFDEFGTYTVSFKTPTLSNAFGYDISDWEPGATGGGKAIGLFRDGQLVFDTFFASDQGNGLVDLPPIFVGLTSDIAFDEVQIVIPSFSTLGPANEDRVDFVAFDEVSFTVPAPAASGVFVLAGIAARRRRA
ncbi:MAG: hypothetical protein AAGI53_06010 [Planctomycetota bacterium]